MTVFTITPLSAPDRQGRLLLLAEWPANNVGPRLNEDGIRGQVFSTTLESFVARAHEMGDTVVMQAEVAA